MRKVNRRTEKRTQSRTDDTVHRPRSITTKGLEQQALVGLFLKLESAGEIADSAYEEGLSSTPLRSKGGKPFPLASRHTAK